MSFANTKATTAGLVGAAMEDPNRLLLVNDQKRSPCAFRLALSRAMGTKRGKGERSFVLETRKQAIGFYRDLVQNLRPWRAAPPKLPDEPAVTPETPTPSPPVFSADEAREPGELSRSTADLSLLAAWSTSAFARWPFRTLRRGDGT